MIRSLKRSSKELGNNDRSPKSKRNRKKVNRYGNTEDGHNFDEIFEEGMAEENIVFSTKTVSENITQNTANTSDNFMNVSNQTETLPVEEVLPMLATMSATIKYLTEKLTNMASEMRSIKTALNFKLMISKMCRTMKCIY